jgi:hypothetical protein
MLKRPEGPKHQAGGGQQHNRQCHLRDDETLTKSPAASCDARISVVHAVDEPAAEEVRGGRDAEDDRRREREDGGEGENAPIDADASDSRNSRWIPPREARHASPVDQQSHTRADAGQQQILRHELPHDAPCACAKCRSYRDLALTRFGSRQQQIGDVDGSVLAA